MSRHNLPLNYEGLEHAYNRLEKVSFDIAVVEKASNVVAITYEGYWKDLGTWNTLTEEIEEKVIGSGALSEDSHSSHIVNELNIPVFVLNVSNVVVAASHEGILVTDKHASPRLKELMKGFEQLIMYEERQWGSYRVLDYCDTEGKQTITKRVTVFDGATWHGETQENEIHTITILNGHCIYTAQEVRKECKKGDTISIISNQSYRLCSQQELEMILVQIDTHK